LFCNPVYILRSCCTLQLINKLLPSLFLFKSNTSPCISSCIFIPYLFRLLAVLVLCHILQHLLFSSIALGTSSFHHHVSVCLGGHFVHPHTCSVAFCHTSFIAFHLLSTLSASNTSFSICYQTSKFVFKAKWFYIGRSQLPYFQPWYVHSLFLPWCRTNDDITNK